ncbi:MAG: carboxypeptidase regulatory-like domain-containing protein [Planctomycetota bacterium]
MNALKLIALVLLIGLAVAGAAWILLHDEPASSPGSSEVPAEDVGSEDQSRSAPSLGELDEGEVSEDALTAVLRGSEKVSGTVFGPDGEPVPGATVVIGKAPDREALARVENGESEHQAFMEQLLRRALDQRSSRKVTTDSKGRFVLPDSARGSFELDAYNETLVLPRGVPIEIPSEETIELRLIRGQELVGRAMDQAGRPVAGVDLVLKAELRSVLDVQDERRTTTDTNGDYVFTGIRDGTQQRIEIDDTRYYLEDGQLDRVEMSGDERLDLRLSAYSVLAGTVVGPSGLPVPEAKVALRGGEESQCDEGGRFRFSVRGREEPFELLGATEDLDWIGQESIVLAVGEVKDEITLRLERSARIVGRVTGASAEALVGAEVTVVSVEPKQNAAMMRALSSLGYVGSSEPTGFVEAEMREQLRVDEMRAVVQQRRSEAMMKFMKQALTSSRQRGELELQQKELELQGLQERSAALRIALDRALAAQRQEEVKLENVLFAERRTVETDENGEYQVLGLKPGHFSTRADHGGYLESDKVEGRLTSLGESLTRDFALVQGAHYWGQVVQSDGEPAPKARIWLLVGEKSQFDQEADEEGLFDFTELPEAEYRVLARSSTGGVAELAAQRFVPGGEYGQARIELQEGARIAGTVTASTAGPLAGARVVLTSRGGPIEESVETDERGGFAIEGLPGGEYRLSFENYDDERLGVRFLGRRDELTLSYGEKRWIDAELAPGATLSGTVTYRSAPITERTLVYAKFQGDNRATILQAGESSFSIDDLPGGPIELFSKTFDGRLLALHDIEMRPGENRTDVNIELRDALSIQGRVLDGNGRPMPGTIVLGVLVNGEGRRKATTDAQGTYTLTSLYAGKYRVEVDGHPESARTIELSGNGKLDLEVR